MSFISIALGGGLGSVLRYLISTVPYKGSFPVPTLLTNLCGAVLIGIIAGLAAKHNWPPNLVLFFKTGVCGGFTTFSTFSLEAMQLLQGGHAVQAFLYMLLSVGLCLIGVYVGIAVIGTVSAAA